MQLRQSHVRPVNQRIADLLKIISIAQPFLFLLRVVVGRNIELRELRHKPDIRIRCFRRDELHGQAGKVRQGLVLRHRDRAGMDILPVPAAPGVNHGLPCHTRGTAGHIMMPVIDGYRIIVLPPGFFDLRQHIQRGYVLLEYLEVFAVAEIYLCVPTVAVKRDILPRQFPQQIEVIALRNH